MWRWICTGSRVDDFCSAFSAKTRGGIKWSLARNTSRDANSKLVAALSAEV